MVSSGLFGKSTISELPKLITDLVHTARSALRALYVYRNGINNVYGDPNRASA